MFIESNRLKLIDNKLNEIKEINKILITYYYIENDYYHLVDNNVIKKTINYIANNNLLNISDILYFFFVEIDIYYGWNNLNVEFKEKFPNIYTTIKYLKENINKVPVYEKNYSFSFNNSIIS